jgi:hypothetical protein
MKNKMKVQMKAQELYMKGKQKLGKKCEPKLKQKKTMGEAKNQT